ncbi:substrate-binding domain-containing protein [Thalassotalea marina]|uniref:substrate-binding domain-containing protein n=1 Tax=Thalassotalea marina TaxID=1673741 RepID=UPI001E50D578|nr:substrate-binding domain-containing protein [Thalassotalea marina]
MRSFINSLTTFSIVLFLLVLSSKVAFAEIVLGVVGKTKNDSFYQQSFKGCQAYAVKYKNVRCIYDGGMDFQNIRAQVSVVKKLVKQGIDGLLIATTDSHFLVKEVLASLKEENIPVITFDSDLLPEHAEYRLAYVGTDNFAFGQALGKYVKNNFVLRAEQSICIQSGHPTTPNLNERIAGIRFALSQQKANKMKGKQGWREHPSCPMFSLGKRDLALEQLESVLNFRVPPIFIAVAGFAQFNENYMAVIEPYKKQIDSGELIVVSADTEPMQLQALAQGLSSINIGQKPFEMGKLGASLLIDYITKQQLPDKSHYYLGFHHCTPETATTCTTNY